MTYPDPTKWGERPDPAHNRKEAKLQAECVLWFSQSFPEKRGKLWANFVEQSAAVASQKLTLGMIKALPDLMYMEWGELMGIELKAHGTVHNTQHLREQCEWLMAYPATGCFCDNFVMFQNIITCGAFTGRSPYMIYEKLKTVTTKSVDWDKLVEGL